MDAASRAPRGMVDAHVHFWDPAVLRYPWLDDLAPIRRASLPDAYAHDSNDVPITRALFVECNAMPSQSVAEVAFVRGLADANPLVAGIVAFVDLASGGAAQALDALAPEPLVKGVRQNIQGEPRGFCLQPSFVEGVREVGGRGLTFDLCAMHDQLDEVAALVGACPATRFVLDHCGKPPIVGGGTPSISDRHVEPWATGVSAIAAHANVACKLSGLLTQAGAGWSDADLAPYAAHVANAFGPSRVMYGSDWPVLTLAGTYAEWFGFTQRFTAPWSVADRAAFYADNAVRTYGL